MASVRFDEDESSWTLQACAGHNGRLPVQQARSGQRAPHSGSSTDDMETRSNLLTVLEGSSRSSTNERWRRLSVAGIRDVNRGYFYLFTWQRPCDQPTNHPQLAGSDFARHRYCC